MSKLVRDNVQGVEAIELSGKSMSTVVLDNIISTANQIKERTQTEDVLLDVADILELLNVFLITENITPQDALSKAVEVRNTLGSYTKKLIIKE